ncbi:MAG TPA: DivIVA domain-containing protein [Gaiellaceae bacterium]
MRYTPVELRHVRPSKTILGGYKRGEVDRLLEDVVESYEEVWRDRGELADKLEDVEKVLAEVKQRESLLASTLVAAEKTAVEQIESAKREAEVIIAEAHQEARSITRTAQSERERLFAESRRVETLLRAALGMVEETASEPALEKWPNRQDTREFKAVAPEPERAPVPEPEFEHEQPVLPPVQEVPAPPVEEDDGGSWTARDFAWG